MGGGGWRVRGGVGMWQADKLLVRGEKMGDSLSQWVNEWGIDHSAYQSGEPESTETALDG